MGRPSLKTPDLVAELLGRLALHDSGLEGVCEADDMPHALTVLRWVREDEEFRKDYTRARESAGEIQAWRAMKAAIGAPDPSSARLEYDARKWVSGKLNGKWYGDKTLIGSDPENPLPSQALDLTGISTAALKELAKLAPNG